MACTLPVIVLFTLRLYVCCNEIYNVISWWPQLLNGYIIFHPTLVVFLHYRTWYYTKTKNLCCLLLSSVSGSKKNRFWCVWSGSELVLWLNHSRCSKWRPFAFTHACSHVCHWPHRQCPKEYGTKCQWASASACQCRVWVLCNVR